MTTGILIESALAILAAAICGLATLQRSRLHGSTKVLFYPLWTLGLVLGCVLLAGLVVWGKFFGSEAQRQESPVMILGGSASCVAVAVAIAVFCRGTVSFDDAGIHAKPGFRKPRFIAWDAISEVRAKVDTITIVGSPGMRISVLSIMVGVRELCEELAARRPDRFPMVRPQGVKRRDPS